MPQVFKSEHAIETKARAELERMQISWKHKWAGLL